MNFNLKSPSSYREWREYFLFRYKILRKPIGLHRSTIRDKLEKISYHVMATNNKGVRDHIELIKKMSMMMPDVKSELKESVEDGLIRYPDWPELTKVKKWLEF